MFSDFNRGRLRVLVRSGDGMDGRSNPAAKNSTLTPLPVGRPCPVEARPSAAGDTRIPAPSREPCPRCAIRGELGCAHFAPFVPGPPPKAERYPSMERHR